MIPREIEARLLPRGVRPASVAALLRRVDGRKRGRGPFGGVAPEVVVTTDSRLTDSRTPLTHTHAFSSLTAAGHVPRWTKYTVGYAALAVAGLTNDIELFSLAASGVIHSVLIRHTASFTGGLISAYTLSVGIAGNLTKYATAFNVFQAPGPNQALGLVGVESFSGATSIRVAAASVTGLLDAATAGSADIYVLTSSLAGL